MLRIGKTKGRELVRRYEETGGAEGIPFITIGRCQRVLREEFLDRVRRGVIEPSSARVADEPRRGVSALAPMALTMTAAITAVGPSALVVGRPVVSPVALAASRRLTSSRCSRRVEVRRVVLRRCSRPIGFLQTSARDRVWVEIGVGSMLRVTTLHASSAAATAAYYADYLTAAPGEAPGRWSGAQARLLGLTGAVEVESLQTLLEGRDPVNDRQLGHRLLDRIDARGHVIRAVSGFDATFSAPKSLSVLWALTQDPRLLDAHDTAVNATLRYLERYGATTRIRADGRRLHPDSLGLTMATFRQTTSRADDPQIHTHAVISAKVQTTDGRWLALDARFLKRHQRTLGGLYQSVLRNELTHHFEFAWTELAHAQAEVLGVPEELLTAFSKRTGAIDAALTAKLDEFRSPQGREPTRWERRVDPRGIRRHPQRQVRTRSPGSP